MTPARSPESPERRSFLKMAAAAVAAPTIVPGTALGLNGAVPPSERLTFACIGVGSRGNDNLRSFIGRAETQILAVCDVDRSHREDAKKFVENRYADATRAGRYSGCDAYNDFREAIARDDVDALSISLPDHWHAIPVIMGAQAGKDIYAEKPLALTIEQGRMMADAVARHGVVFQTGSQQRSDRRFRHACELVRNGRIGKLQVVKAGLPTGPTIEPQAEEPIPEGFDYDFWLGPAPWAPYTKRRCHWDFRWNLDYSGGQLTDWAAHHCDIAQWGMGTERTGPVSIEGRGEYPTDGLWTAAIHYHFDCTYANGVVLQVGDDLRGGATFEGTDGWVWVNRGAIEASDPALLEETFAPHETRLVASDDHHGNFLECVRTRREPIAPIEVAHRSISIAHLGNICMRLGRKLNWDPDKERFVGDPEADRMLSRSMRAPWAL